jgi:hypothetical protein
VEVAAVVVRAVLPLGDGVVEMIVVVGVGIEIEEMEVDQVASSLGIVKGEVVSNPGIVIKGVVVVVVVVGVVAVMADPVVCLMVHRMEVHMHLVEEVMCPAFSTYP